MDDILVVCKCNGNSIDILIPKDIPVDQLISVLRQRLKQTNPFGSFIRSENPVGLLTGNIPVSSFGLHDGSILYI